MSLTSTWVQADDGYMYQDPVLRGGVDDRRWFICFDDDDPPELVLEVFDQEWRKENQKIVEIAKTILSDLVYDKFRCNGSPCSRVFSSTGFKWRTGASFFFNLRGKLPARMISEYGKRMPEDSRISMGHFYKF